MDRRMEEPGQAEQKAEEKSLSEIQDVKRMERSDSSTEGDEVSFQEKVLAKNLCTRTENGHTWVRRES